MASSRAADNPPQPSRPRAHGQIPWRRVAEFGAPDEVAAAVLFMASPQAAFIVGTELIVDGGMSQL
jgi:NAD(P)-dependent dehydrogenase (short-subunit alcohol dehydrogenase family)